MSCGWPTLELLESMKTTTRILLVEDSAELRSELVDYLSFYGYEVEQAGDLAGMRECLAGQACDVLLLDPGLPDGDGLNAIDWLRERYGLRLGIIMISARDDVEDRVAAIAGGADCYLVKPVNLRELRAVINQLAARVAQADQTVCCEGECDDHWWLDEVRLQLHAPGCDRPVDLTGAQMQLLRTLLRQAGEVVTRERLCEEIYANQRVTDTRRLDSLVSRLRSKVERTTGQTLPVHVFRNVGYMFPVDGRPPAPP